MDRDAFWAESVRRALEGDRSEQWEIQQLIASAGSKAETKTIGLNPETGESGFLITENPVDLPEAVVRYLAIQVRRITDGEIDARTAFLSTQPQQPDQDRQSEIAMRVRWYVRREKLSVKAASKRVADEYVSINWEWVRRIAKDGENRKWADAVLDWYEEIGRAPQFPILEKIQADSSKI